MTELQEIGYLNVVAVNNVDFQLVALSVPSGVLLVPANGKNEINVPH